MKKRYTKKQIQEAIAYWERQLKSGNYRKVNESEDEGVFDPEQFLMELKDRMTADRDFENKFGDAYRRLNPGWNGDMNDDDYLDWEYDFLSQATERAERAGGDIGWAFADMRQALDRVIQTGRDDYIQ